MIHIVLITLRGARPLLMFFFISPLLLFSQKHDYVWQFGKPYNLIAPDQINVLNFHSNPPLVDSISSDVQGKGGYLSMCDSAGNLAFVSNGLLLQNGFGVSIAGSDSFNFRFNAIGQDNGGSQGKKGLYIGYTFMALPWPDSEGVYVVLHQTYEEYPTNFKTDRQYYTVVDMRANGWLGQVTKLNRVLLDKHVETGQASACRHSNGRDWWVLVKEAYPSNAYHRFLLTPTGWHRFEDTQEIGGPGYGDGSFYTANGVVFSPDGQQHIRAYEEGVYVFDFDRCAGLLSNYRKIPVIPTPPQAYPDYILSPSVSPNGKYLYICNDGYLVRYDLRSTNVAATRDTVATGDGFTWQGLPTIFGISQLAPDGKIYINTFSTTPYLQVISQPDSINPMVLQHHVRLPELAVGLPIYPNYRLGQVPGNPCPSGGGIPMDTTVGVDLLPSRASGGGLRVWPNPARERLVVELPTSASGNVELVSATGILLKTLLVNGKQTVLDLAGVPAGVYSVRVKTQEGALLTTKLVILP